MSHPTSIFCPSWLAIAAALAVFFLFTPQAMAQSASAAKARLSMANEMLDKERFDEVEPSLQQAEKQLQGLSAAERDPILKGIAEVRARVEPAKKAAAARKLRAGIERELRSAEDDIGPRPYDVEKRLTSVSARLGSDEVTKALEAPDIAKFKARVEEIRKKLATSGGETPAPAITANVNSAKSRVMSARNAIESRRFENVEFTLEEAEKYLAGLSEAERAPVLRDIAEVRGLLAEAEKAEEVRKYEERLNRYIRSADGNVEPHPTNSADQIRMTKELLASEDVKRVLGPAKIGEFRTRLAEVEKKLAAALKADALDRAQDFARQLEEALAGDPLEGKDEIEAYKAWRGLDHFQNAAKLWLAEIPKDDPDRRALEGKLAELKKRSDALSDKWGQAQVEAAVKSGWQFASQDSAGWEEEKPDPAKKPNEMWMMRKTASAVRNAAYWMNNDQIKKLKADNPENAVVKATFAEAEKTLDAAAAKLNDAFQAAMTAAEKMPTPSGSTRFDRVIASWMAQDAEGCFEGTRYQEANVARAKALDARWEQEILAMQKAAAELRAKLSKEADAAWPAIVEKLGPDADFTPGRLVRSKGDRILIKRIYNRSGWDFDGQYDFTVRIDGVPIAGNFTKEINDSIQAMWEKMSAPPLDSWEEWDVIAVVEGPATVHRRVTTELIAADTREVIGKIEGHKDEPGVEVRIIGLHAGPMAVGSK